MTEYWRCPKCGHKQHEDFVWCGKNLKCPSCGHYSYYRGWIVTDSEEISHEAKLQ